MTGSTTTVEATEAEAERIGRVFPSFRDFVDAALFDPAWGYYSTGKVRFGEGGHYDTFPLALSPLFGRMLAQYAFRFWRRAGEPQDFEICELGAGNGQLCLDVLVTVAESARGEPAWMRFARRLRYRIIERSPALIVRQRQHLGPLARRVRWTHADLAQPPRRRLAAGRCGIVFANEVLDCLAHHKIAPCRDRTPGVVFVVPALRPGTAALDGFRPVQGIRPGERAVRKADLARVLGEAGLRPCVSFEEVVLPVSAVPGLDDFLRRHYPEFFAARKRFRPYFACPAIETLVHSAGRLYDQVEILWIDYGDTREFHLGTAASQRLFAGPPRSGASVYRAPGADDVTFLVDFSVVADAAAQAGLRVKFFGPQGELARRSGVVLDDQAVELMAQCRALGWLLAVAGVGPERNWRHTGLTWSRQGGTGVGIRSDAKRAVAEFLGKRRSNFKLMIMSR